MALPGRSRSVMVHLQVRMHTDELKQPNQLYLKEALSMWVNQRVYPCMHMYLLTKRELDQQSPYNVVPGPFIAPVHVPCDVTDNVIA